MPTDPSNSQSNLLAGNTAPSINVDGELVFKPGQVEIPRYGYYATAHAEDMDGDGDLDIVVVDKSGDKLDWYANDGQGNISGTATSMPIGAYGYAVKFADIDGDGKNDLIVTSNGNTADDAAAGQVNWYKGNGDGTFGNAQMVVSGILNAFETAAVDFDNDGDIDLVTVGTNETQRVTISTNNGDGTFTNSDLTVGAVRPQTVKVLDMNGDGRLDIVTGGSLDISPEGFGTGAAAVVSINNGDGTYTDTTLVVSTGNPSVWDVEIADLNGDGILDVVATNPNSASVTWFAGNSDGSYSAGVNIGNDQWSGRVDTVLADMDGDGDIDVVTTESESSSWPMPISWFENDGNGNFTEHKTSAVAEAEASVTVADIDGNGTLDIIRGGQAGGKAADVEFGFKVLHVRENAASPLSGISFSDSTTGTTVTVTLTANSGTLTGTSANGVTVAGSGTGTVTLTGSLTDINAFIASEAVAFTTAQDAEADVKLTITINDGVDAEAKTAQATILLEVTPENEAAVINVDAGISYQRPTVSVPADGIFSTAQAVDMDGDGDLDILVMNSSANRIDWHENDGAGNISGTHSINVGTFGQSVEVADIDGDGKMDLVATLPGMDNPADGKVAWFKGNGDGTFGAAQTVVAGRNNPNMTFAVDIDNDGDIDIVSTSSGDHNKVVISTNDGAGNFTSQELDIGVGSPMTLQVVDLNGDGLLDIINGGTATISPEGIGDGSSFNVSMNNGDGTFTTTTTTVADRSPVWDIEVGDFDGDGTLDLLVTNPSAASSLLIYKGVGDGTFEAPVSLGDQTGGRLDAVVGDIDGDGDLDIASMENAEGSSGAKTISWFENDGSGNFTEHKTGVLWASSGSTGSVSLGDLNGDGLLDIIRGGRAGSGGARGNADVSLAYKTMVVETNETTSLSGISFSDNETGATVTVTLSVPSGTLAAQSGSGVTVAGSGGGGITLTGSLADINAFMAGDNVSFTTAQDAGDDVKLTISIDDGAANAKVATTTVLLDVVTPNLEPTDLALTGDSVDEESAAGTVVGTLSATDPEGQPLTYILTDNAGGKFSLVTENGVTKLVVAGELDFETSATHDVTVQVSDGKNEVSKTFSITVNDIVENLAPTNLALSNDEVAENSDAGTVIGTLSATDPEGQPLTYSLAQASDLFEIVGNELRVKGHLDYEQQTSHSITVKVSDGVKETTQVFTIAVTDVDDVATPLGTITIDATGSASMDFEAYIRGGFESDTVGGGFPVFDNSGQFEGEEMFIGYGSEATSKYVLMHGDLEYYFNTHTVAGTANTVEYGTKGSGTYDANGYFTGGNVELKITGLNLSNPTPNNSTEEQQIEANGAIHNFAIAHMYGAPTASTQPRYDKYADSLDAYAQHYLGASGTDIYAGTQFDDTIESNGGNDTVAGGGGNDIIDGGEGIDTAVYTGNKADYTYIDNGNGTWTVTDTRVGAVNDGIDTLKNIEFLKFADETVAIVSDLPNSAPTGLALSVNSVKENAANGTVIGILSALDADDDVLTYTLTDDAGGKFSLATTAGVTSLVVNGKLDYETAKSHSVTVMVDDGNGGETSRTFSVKVTDVVEKISGTSGNDKLNGGWGADLLDGGKGNDVLKGNAGADILDGGKGIDKLYGGGGADTFVFSKGDTGKMRSNADTIFDFNPGQGDIIDLSDWDANSKKAGDQDFKFIGTDAFHGKAGELRFVKEKSDTWIMGDTNGDKKADFMIHLDDAVNLKLAHFDF